MNRATVRLLAVFGLLGAALAGLIALNPTHFTSIDSEYYLQSATHLLAGRGYVVVEEGHLVWNSTFPMGYSALIAAVSGVTGLPVLVASKLVNYVAVGLSGWAWVRRLDVRRAGWLLSVWGLGGFLKIMAYTWSETVFLVLLAEWVWCLYRFLTEPNGRRAAWVGGLGVALFLVRYVGGFALLLVGFMLLIGRFSPVLRNVFNVVDKGRTTLLLAVGGGLFGIGLYVGLNHWLVGSAVGGPRLLRTESATELAVLFARSTLNELLLIRDVEPNEPNALAWLGVVVQAGLLLLAYRIMRRKQPADDRFPDLNHLSRLFILVGLAYGLVLFGLRVVSPFSGPNLRLMAPATFCLLTAGLLWISTLSSNRQRSIWPLWIGLLVCSWLQLLPQRSTASKLRNGWERIENRGQSQHSMMSRSPVWASMRTKPSCAASLLLPVR